MMNRNLSKTSCSNSIRSFDNLSGASGSSSRRDFIKVGAGIAAILAAGKAPSAIVRSMCGLKNLMIAGGGGLSAKSYIQDGIVAMWDGIENAGWGQHDPNATTWKNLVVDGMLDISLNGSYSITDDSVIFTGGYGLADKYDFTGNVGATISILASYRSLTSNLNGWSYRGVSPRLAAYYDGGGWYLSSRYNPPKITVSYSTDTVYRYDFIWDVSRQILSVYKNGMLAGSATDNPYLGNPANHFRMMASGSISDTVYETYKGEVFSCIVYAKALSDADVATNYAVDKERFNLS